jgi:hypothetical protein
LPRSFSPWRFLPGGSYTLIEAGTDKMSDLVKILEIATPPANDVDDAPSPFRLTRFIRGLFKPDSYDEGVDRRL